MLKPVHINTFFLELIVSLSLYSSKKWKYSMEKFKLVLIYQNATIDLTQFGATIWAKHNTHWEWNKLLNIMTLVWRTGKSLRKRLTMSLSQKNATNVSMHLLGQTFWGCIWKRTVHNAQFVQYLYLATEQAGTYLKSGPVWHHLTYINPTLFSCEIDIENSILVSFKL